MEGEPEYCLEDDALAFYPTIVAHRIVESIRERILQDMEEEEEEDNDGSDPWDEEKGGVGWVDNEVGMAIELLHIIYNQSDYPDLSECDNVEECVEVLAEEFELRDLHFIDFVIQLGASSTRAFFALREYDSEYIRNWCQHRGFEF
jgi:hypothetical protein